MRFNQLVSILLFISIPALAGPIEDLQKSLAGKPTAADVRAPSASGPQWDGWNPANSADLGSPAFKPVTVGKNSLFYGFRGAVVLNGATGKAERIRMTTITRSKVEGYVNQLNDRFALAAGLHEIAVFDFSKGKWMVKERVTTDDSTGALSQNLVMGADFVQVRQLNGPLWRYTTANGWQEIRK